ncbi:MAG: enoyl-CoA hydratase/isomerase family protein [Planctomycetes bacterium]|nr:enoyl-CoA hydratase/isomerase family protein [Planctomycetota bacterium]
MPELIHIDDRDGIRTLSLNRPEARNALSLPVIEALESALAATAADPAVRVLVLRGEGKSFCAGMDLRGVIDDPVRMGTMLHTLARCSLAIRSLRVPAIACVRGAAIGGGCGLMATCDLALTHAEARLGYPEVDLGICPAVVAPILMRRIGAGRARAMLLTGGVVDGTEAHRLGLATHLAPEADLESAARSLAERLAAGGAEAIATTKAWLADLESELDAQTMRRAADLSARIIQGPEAQQRLRAKFAPPPRTDG